MKPRITGSMGMLLGSALIAPGAILLANKLLLHSVAFRATWIPRGFAILAICGVAIILASTSFFDER